MMMPLETKFWSRVDRRGENDCWLWTGPVDAFGRGRFYHDGQTVRAPRVAFLLGTGSWPSAFACHRCDNPACCNPSHIFDGTHSANMADMVSKARHFRHSQTHCKRGHAFTPENTRSSRGRRVCRTCERLSKSQIVEAA